MNTQPQEKRVTDDGSSLDVINVFKTIQGEGPYSGKASVFVRLAGCNLQCPKCDTDYTTNRTRQTTANLVADIYHANSIANLSASLVVITGGEPFRQNITPLCEALLNKGFRYVQIETNGTLPPSPGLPKRVHVVCSPKSGKIHAKLLPYIRSYKYVMNPGATDAFDGLPKKMLGAPSKVAKPHSAVLPVYLTPEAHPKTQKVQPETMRNLIASTMQYRHIAQCQLHKYLGVE